MIFAVRLLNKGTLLTNSEDIDTTHGCANCSGAFPVYTLKAFLSASGPLFFSVVSILLVISEIKSTLVSAI